MASLAKWFSVRLEAKWLWVGVQLQSHKTSDMSHVSSKKLLEIQENIEYGFTLKRVRDMIKKYSQVLFIHLSFISTVKYIHQSWNICKGILVAEMVMTVADPDG